MRYLLLIPVTIALLVAGAFGAGDFLRRLDAPESGYPDEF